MDEKELVEVIEQAAREEWAELDLSNERLWWLPPELGQLCNLKVLNLCDNELAFLPPEVGLLRRLERLYLRTNGLTELPAEIGQLQNLKVLDVSYNWLVSLPAAIGQLASLMRLELERNKLKSLPVEIGQLSNLVTLDVDLNPLARLPEEIGGLRKLSNLCLGVTELESLPREVGQLTNLEKLSVWGTRLTELPAEIGGLVSLEKLVLSNNELELLPPEIGQLINMRSMDLRQNQLASLPVEIGKLTNLLTLDVRENRLTSFPGEIGQLKNLTKIYLSGNELSSLPAGIGQLKNVTELYLSGNRLSSLPSEIGKLTRLTELDLRYNQLRELPAEVGKLTELTELDLRHNQLRELPAEIGHLSTLGVLDVRDNKLTRLPPEMGLLATEASDLEDTESSGRTGGSGGLAKAEDLEGGLDDSGVATEDEDADLGDLDLDLEDLELLDDELTWEFEEARLLTNLNYLGLKGNPLESPPPEVVEQGTQAILVYLREQLKEGKRQWVSKLLVIGEGGVGKTSLLRAVRGEEFIEGLETTHGIGVGKLELTHPSEAGVTMELTTWDFGGQQIYHATHQFFLTKRSLFVLVWDARHGWEAGKLYNWLERIRARAPESPVMIVAAHIDERDADLPLEDLRGRYPQIVGHYKISNKEGVGVEEFREKLADVAAELPLMGGEWPASWLDAANEIRGMEESYISPKKVYKVMAELKVRGESANVLAQWLHELGDILYFREDEELSDIVILNPVWVTEAISKVLESDEVIERDGIFTRRHMDELWSEVDEGVRGHFLRLMERFDLSYRTLENREISLVVERLPLAPADYRQKWDGIKERDGCKEISMKFTLSSVPAGIPTWFIARSHRFTTHTHWRLGALFADSEEEQHLSLIEADRQEKIVRLTVRGPAPHNFFSLLRDGLELTLGRFPGLRVKRTVPCPGHDGGECVNEFDFGQLQKAIERAEPVIEVQCQEAFENVSVPGLLFGLHWKTEGNVITRIDELEGKVLTGQENIVTELGELRELTQREFLRLFNAQQGLAESHCPNVFAVLPKEKEGWENILGQKMVLRLYCQAPGEWHPTLKGGRYEIKKAAEFLKSMGPYILKLAKVIKYAAPVAGAAAGLYAGPIGAVMGAEFAKKLAGQIKLMEELAKKLSERDYLEAEMLERTGVGAKAERIEGAELRALRKMLDEADPNQEWGGLEKVLTPEGHYLWLCEEHVKEYKK